MLKASASCEPNGFKNFMVSLLSIYYRRKIYRNKDNDMCYFLVSNLRSDRLSNIYSDCIGVFLNQSNVLDGDFVKKNNG